MQERKQLFRLGDNMVALFPKDALKAFPINFETEWTSAAGNGWVGSDLQAKLSGAIADAAYLVDNGSLMNVITSKITAELVTDAVVRWVVIQSGKAIIKELTVVANVASLTEYTLTDAESGAQVILMTGYTKGDSYSAIVTTDTLLDAIGKLEAGVNELQTQVGDADSGLEKLIRDFIATKAKANGLASLDAQGKVPASQLPSFVDDVLDVTFVANEAAIPTTGLVIGQLFYGEAEKKLYAATSETAHGAGTTPESGKIYVNLANENTYRWSGSTMVEISQSLALGETEATAYVGARGKENRAAIVSNPATIVTELVEVRASATNNVIAAKAVTKSGLNYGAAADKTITIPAATDSLAGVMTAKDKKNLDAVIEAMGGDPSDPNGGNLTPETADFLKKSDAGIGVLKDWTVAGANTPVAANDTINVAIGKLQKSVNDIKSGDTKVIVKELPTVTDSTIIAGDTLETVISKLIKRNDELQAEIDALKAIVSPTGYELVYVPKA